MPPERTSRLTLALLALSCGEHVESAPSADPTAGDSMSAPTAADAMGSDSIPSSGTVPDATGPAGTSGSTAPGGTGPVGGSGASPTIATPTATTTQTPAPTDPVDGLVIEASPAPADGSCWSGIESDDEVATMLEPYVITKQATLQGRTLFSWTTAEQIEELKADPTLLTRSADSNGEKGRAADLIHERAEADPVAALLDGSEYANKRFGWISPWATLLGWSGEDYGDRLLAVTLKPDAIIATLVGNTPLEWAFSDAQGNPIAEEEVIANPQRLAAVYFIDPRDTGYCGGTIARAGSVFREFFVCNEGMIESWSAFTPAIQAELERNVAALEAFRSALDAARCEPWVQDECHPTQVLELWLTPKEDLPNTMALYFSALAFPNGLYAPTVATMDTLLERLRLVPMADDPLTHSYD